jgi:hypothetical protein
MCIVYKEYEFNSKIIFLRRCVIFEGSSEIWMYTISLGRCVLYGR